MPAARFSEFEVFRHHVHYLANAMLKDLDTPWWGRLTVGGLPWDFSATPGETRAGTPPGHCTHEVRDGLWPAPHA